MPDPALRDRLAEIIYDAEPWLSLPRRQKIADVLLASEEWQARETKQHVCTHCGYVAVTQTPDLTALRDVADAAGDYAAIRHGWRSCDPAD